MTIEEVSVLFDTGRKGDAQHAARALGAKSPKEMDDMAEDDKQDADLEKAPEAIRVSHIE